MYRPCGTFDETYAQDMAIIRTPQHWGLLIGGLALLLILPLFASGRMLSLINLIGISVISAHGLSILTGYTGQISLGHTAFMCVGAYTTGLLAVYLKLPFWITLPCSGITAGVVGMIFGLPSLRLKGFYLAMATLAAQFIIPWLVVNVRPDITGGTDTMVVPPPRIGDFIFNSQQSIFYIIIPVAILVTFLVRSLVRTRIGRAFTAIRDNDLAAEAMGISLFRYKLMAFFLCSFYAGIAGCLWAYWMRAINVDHFTLFDSIWYLGMIIVGGMGSVPGAVFGTCFIRILDLAVKIIGPKLGEVLPAALAVSASAALGPFVFGLVILLLLIFDPRGLSHRWEVFKSSYRLWPFSY